MKGSIFTLAAAAAILAGCAEGPSPSTDPAIAAASPEAGLCAEIGPLIAAAREPTPFASLSEPTAAGQSIGYRAALPALGMPEQRNCQVYVAGSPEGVVGGGAFNYVSCTTFTNERKSVEDRTDAEAAQARITEALATCSVLEGWAFSPADRDDRLQYATWRDPGSMAQVVSALRVDRRRSKNRNVAGKTLREVSLIVRAPNPAP